MSTPPELNRDLRSWLREDRYENADRALLEALTVIDSTPQRRAGWLARRFPLMNNNTLKYGLAAVAFVVVALVAWNYLPTSTGGPGPEASPSPTLTPMPLPAEGDLEAGTYVATPFAPPDDFGVCDGQPDCTESPADDSIAFTVTVPEGWSMSGLGGIWVDSNGPPNGAMLIFWRGGWLYEEPCSDIDATPSIEVGPTAEDFANALADHPLIDATAPVDVTLGGYSGKYVDVTAPADIDQCANAYRLWDPGIYAQGPNQRWHLWILNVEGTRVVVQTMDYPTTPAGVRAQLEAMVNSLAISP